MEEKNIFNQDIQEIHPYIERNKITVKQTENKKPNIFSRTISSIKNFFLKIKVKFQQFFIKTEKSINQDKESNNKVLPEEYKTDYASSSLEQENEQDKDKPNDKEHVTEEKYDDIINEENEQLNNNEQNNIKNETILNNEKDGISEKKEKELLESEKIDKRKEKEERKAAKKEERSQKKEAKAKVSKVILEGPPNYSVLGYPYSHTNSYNYASGNQHRDLNKNNSFQHAYSDDIIKEKDSVNNELIKDKNYIETIVDTVLKQKSMTLDIKLADDSVLTYTHDENNKDSVKITHTKDGETILVSNSTNATLIRDNISNRLVPENKTLMTSIITKAGIYYNDVVNLTEQIQQKSEPIEKAKFIIEKQYEKAINENIEVKYNLSDNLHIVFVPEQFLNKEGNPIRLCDAYLYESKDNKLVNILYKTEKEKKENSYPGIYNTGTTIGDYDKMLNICAEIIINKDQSIDQIIQKAVMENKPNKTIQNSQREVIEK